MSPFEELAKTVAELKQEVDRLKAARECSNLVGRWLFYAPSCRFEEICSLWAQHSEGTRMEVHGFIYEGIRGVRQYFLNENIAHDNLELRKGLMNVQVGTTEVMEVAEDGETARATYISPGLETDVYRNRPGFEELVADLGLEEGKAYGKWAWKKYAFEFIREDGIWKIWRFRQYPFIKTPYERCWTTKLPFPAAAYENNGSDRVSSSPRWFYGVNAIYPDYDPDPPVQYKNIGDLNGALPFIEESE